MEAMDDGPRPFRAFLDVGLTRTTTGNRIFAAMKGALDGGIDIPHRCVTFHHIAFLTSVARHSYQ